MPDKTEIEQYLLRMGWLVVDDLWFLYGSDNTYKLADAHRLQSALDDAEDRRVWESAYAAAGTALVENGGLWTQSPAQCALAGDAAVLAFRARFPRGP